MSIGRRWKFYKYAYTLYTYTEKLFISIFTIVFFNLAKNVSLRIFVSKNTKLYNNDMKL